MERAVQTLHIDPIPPPVLPLGLSRLLWKFLPVFDVFVCFALDKKMEG